MQSFRTLKQVILNESKITSGESSAVRKVWDKQEHKFKAKKACLVIFDLFDFENMKEKVFLCEIFFKKINIITWMHFHNAD